MDYNFDFVTKDGFSWFEPKMKANVLTGITNRIFNDFARQSTVNEKSGETKKLLKTLVANLNAVWGENKCLAMSMDKDSYKEAKISYRKMNRLLKFLVETGVVKTVAIVPLLFKREIVMFWASEKLVAEFEEVQPEDRRLKYFNNTREKEAIEIEKRKIKQELKEKKKADKLKYVDSRFEITGKVASMKTPEGELLIDKSVVSKLKDWKIGFSNGYVVLIKDAVKVARAKKPYRKASGSRIIKPRQTKALHLLVTGIKHGLKTVHINGNVMDNRKANLHILTKEETLASQAPKSSEFTSFKGVEYYSWGKSSKRWWAVENMYGLKKSLGNFETELEAAKAYNEYVMKTTKFRNKITNDNRPFYSYLNDVD